MSCEKDFMDWPGEHTMGRTAGTGTAVGGTGTSELGCQLRWRFLGGPEVIVKDPKNKPQTPKMKPEWHQKIKNKDNKDKIKSFLQFWGLLPGLSSNSAVRYPWLWAPNETWEGLSKGGRPSTLRPFVGPFTLRAVGTGEGYTVSF